MSTATVLDTFYAGGVAGSVGILVTQPFDVIKVRQQTGGGTMRQVARSLLSTSGLSSMWRGWFWPCATNGAVNSILFVSFEACMRRLDERSVWAHAAAGWAAGGAAALVISPQELVKCVAQVETGASGASFHNDLRITKALVREHGVRGLFRGLPITMLRDLPSFALYFGVYAWLTRECGWSTFASGGWAGVASWFFVMPLDVVKTEWQVSATRGSFVRFARDLLAGYARTVGLRRALFRGTAAACLRAWPQHGVTFAVYEFLTRRGD